MTKKSFRQWCYFMISPEDSERLSFNLAFGIRPPAVAQLIKSFFWIVVPVALILGIEWLTSL